MAHLLHAANPDVRMLIRGQGNRQSADGAEVFLRQIMSLVVQFLVLEHCRTLLAGLLVLLAMGPLAVHAAVLHESTGRAALELDDLAPLLAAVGTQR